MLNNKTANLFVRCLAGPNSRTFKNFGHKRQPTAGVTMLWHGFLTFTFIGLGVEWERIARFMLGGDDVKISFDPTDPVPRD